MASTGLNIAVAVFSLLSLGCGISWSVLVSQLLGFIYQRIEDREHVTETGAEAGVKTAMWMIGLAYIIPGFLGLIGCCTRRRGVFAAQVSLTVVGLVILGVLFLLGMASAGLKSHGPHLCEEVDGMCMCGGEPPAEILSKYFSCSEINWMTRMGISTDAMLFGGGVICLIAAILAGCMMSQLRKEGCAGMQGTVLSQVPTQVQGKFKANPYERFYE